MNITEYRSMLPLERLAYRKIVQRQYYSIGINHPDAKKLREELKKIDKASKPKFVPSFIRKAYSQSKKMDAQFSATVVE